MGVNCGADGFRVAKELFLEKWSQAPYDEPRTGMPQFLDHFRNEWANRFWNRRELAPGTVMHNNGVEASNKVIKDEVTHRTRPYASQFIKTLMEWVGHESQRYIQNKSFAHTVSFTIPDYRNAINSWREFGNTHYCKISGNDPKEEYVVAGAKCEGRLDITVARSIYDKITRYAYDSFDEFKQYQSHEVAIVSRNADKDEQFACTCRGNGKEFKCKHSIAIALFHRTLVAPAEAAIYVFGKKRRRGRPSKVAPQHRLAPPRLQHLHSSSARVLMPSDNVANLSMLFEEIHED